jgi:hypothetical protein
MLRPTPAAALSARLALAAFLGVGALGVAATPVAAQVPGPNVNVISVDKYLQKQNEVDLTISPRNPCHIVAAANDYRTVDNRGLNTDGEIGDSWIGVYISTDCGDTWLNYIMSGYGKSFTTAADPMARFGPGGGLYISHIQFNRGTNVGKVAIARYLDFNNVEGVPKPAEPAEDQSDLSASPVGFLGFTDIAKGSAGRFLDKPSIAVAPGSGGACTVSGYSIPSTNVYVAWTEFVSNSDLVVRNKVYFARSTDCGQTLAGPATKLSEGYPVGQGTVIAVHPTNPNIIYVAWRQVGTAKFADTILVVKSTNGGRSFTKAQPVMHLDGQPMPGLGVAYRPFDQPTTPTTFRTLGYPTMVLDETGRVYLAVSARTGTSTSGRMPSNDPDGGAPVMAADGRIIVTSTTDGVMWEPPVEVDKALTGWNPGHQFMPALAYAAGRLNLTWYDLRYDESGALKPFADERDVLTTNGGSGIRHTLDVRGAQADAVWPLAFNVYGVSDIGDNKQKISLYLAQRGSGATVDGKGRQLNFNRGNLKLYSGGTQPFMGDYIGTAGVQYVPAVGGGWIFNGKNVDASNAVLRTFQAAWTDNRDAIVGEAGDSPATPNSSLNYVNPQTCSPADLKYVNSRNANIYTSRVTPGLYLSAVGNTKPTNQIERAYAIQVENGTDAPMTVRLSVAAPNGVVASFAQLSTGASQLTEKTITVGKNSSAAQTVYVSKTTANKPYPPIEVTARELIGGEPTGQRAAVVLNGDPTNPMILQPGNGSEPITGNSPKDTHTPRVENPRVENQNPRDMNVKSPRVENPRVENPRVENPRVENTTVETPRVENPRVENSAYENVPFSDITYQVTNDGNTTSTFNLDLRTSAPTSGYAFQLLGFRAYRLPMAGADCLLRYTEVPQIVFNLPLDPADLGANGLPPSKQPSIVIRPGETVGWTIRAYDTNNADGFVPFCTDPVTAPGVTDCTNKLTGSATAQAANTGETVPKTSSYPVAPADLAIQGTLDITNPLPAGGQVTLVRGDVFTTSAVMLRNTGGNSAPDGFECSYNLYPYGGEFSSPYVLNAIAQSALGAGASRSIPATSLTVPAGGGDVGPIPLGTYQLTVQADSAGIVSESNELNNELLSATLVQVVPQIAITTTAVPPYLAEGAEDLNFATFAATGGVGATTWTAVGLPDGMTMSSAGVVGGTPAEGTAGLPPSENEKTYTFSVTATDSSPLKGSALSLHSATRTYVVTVFRSVEPVPQHR